MHRSYADGDRESCAAVPGRGLFLVTAGAVEVSVEQAGARHHLPMFTAGGTTFGVAYAVAGREYDIDATARGDVEAMVLPAPAIADLATTALDDADADEQFVG